jgi:hypothetical protein
MKIIQKPSVPAVAQFKCDVTGVQLPTGPAASITIRGGSGPGRHGDTLQVHLSEAAAEVVVLLLRALIVSGVPLAPHPIGSLLGVGSEESHVARQDHLVLLRRLEKLGRYLRRTLASVKKVRAKADRGASAKNAAKRKRKRVLLAEYEELIRQKTSSDKAADIDAIRGD